MPKSAKREKGVRGPEPRRFQIQESGFDSWFPDLSSQAQGDSLFLVQQAHRLQYHRPHNFHALWTELVQRVLRRVVEDVAITIVEIDQIRAGNAAPNEWQVVIFQW